MSQPNQDQENKLIPLRTIAKESPYSAAYLSILVQRNKLRAERIGRNYYTTKEWFQEYLDKHGREDKVGELEKTDIQSVVNRLSKQNRTDAPGQMFPPRFFRFAGVFLSVLAISVLLSNYLAWRAGDKTPDLPVEEIMTDGRVAGIAEERFPEGRVKGEKISSSTAPEPELKSENFTVRQMNFGGDMVVVADNDDYGDLQIYEVKSEPLIVRARDKEERKLLISWKTNKLAVSEIEYGKSGEVNLRKVKESAYGFNHSLVISGLEQGVTYNYNIKAKDRWGNEIEPGHYAAYSGSRTITTFELITKTLGEIFGWASLNRDVK